MKRHPILGFYRSPDTAHDAVTDIRRWAVQTDETAPLRDRLDAFDSATLQDVVDGKADRLPLGLSVDTTTQAIDAEILKERTPAPTE